MSDIRFNRWLHQSGTGGVSQSDGGHVGIGTTNPLIPVGAGNTHILNVGVVTCNNISAGSSITAGTFYGSGANLTSLSAANLTGTLPAISGANLTNLDASDLASGTVPDARFPATLPAVSGANLTGLPAGLGTALSTVQSSPLNKLYYTDRILSIGSTLTIDHPASATGAYTHYADIQVEDDADLIVADGDDLIPDILGLGGNGTTGAGGAGRLLVDNIVNRSATGAPTFPNGTVVTGIVTATSFVSDTPLSHRNALINGEMLISQRGTSESSVSSTGYKNAPDRWQFYAYPSGQSGVYTVSQLAGGPHGFQKSYRVACTTADTSLQADSGVILRQTIEEQYLQYFKKGFPSAKQMTLSFFAKTNKTGTYVVELYDMRNIRHVSATYTVSDTNWNRYVITFPADTSGQFSAGSNGGGMIVHWWLVAGTNYQSGSLATSWTANTNANRAVGQLNFADSTSNIFDLTGCQLEAGPVATPYEHRTFHDYLHACKRYFQFVPPTLGEAQHSTNIQGCLTASPPMRAAPTCAIKVTSNNINLAGAGPKTCTSIGTLYYNSTQGGWAEMGGSNFSQYRNYYILPNCFTFSAEF